VEGHTDNVGNPKSNKTLSNERANSVVAAIISQGIDAKRLSAAGYGQDKPIADNKTEEGRAKNRRVELVRK
jgi:outer membrane protein OmpA-like peptidoglycan-associated protein